VQIRVALTPVVARDARLEGAEGKGERLQRLVAMRTQPRSSAPSRSALRSRAPRQAAAGARSGSLRRFARS
jgi:hypothetical protein